jgi:hypothetical protein
LVWIENACFSLISVYGSVLMVRIIFNGIYSSGAVLCAATTTLSIGGQSCSLAHFLFVTLPTLWSIALYVHPMSRMPACSDAILPIVTSIGPVPFLGDEQTQPSMALILAIVNSECAILQRERERERERQYLHQVDPSCLDRRLPFPFQHRMPYVQCTSWQNSIAICHSMNP